MNDSIDNRNECAVRFGNRRLRARANNGKNRKRVGGGEGTSKGCEERPEGVFEKMRVVG